MHLFNVDLDPSQGRPKRPPDEEKNRNLLFLKSWMFSMEG
jgi:hypothetical protein